MGGTERISQQPSISLMADVTFAFARTQILTTALELDVFTKMDEGLSTVEQLAESAGASHRGMRILLNALVGMEVLRKQNERYELTESARVFLSRKSPSYAGGMVLHSNVLKQNWEQLTEVVRTGKPAGNVAGEEDRGHFFSQFVDALYAMNQPGAEAAARVVTAGGGGLRVLDVGAGSGVWSIAIARLDSQARVTVVDWPEVIQVTRKFVDRFNLSDRFEYLPGDFREVDFGEDKYDVATLGHICHSEGEQHTRELFARLRRALKPGGQVVIGEFLADEARQSAVFPLIFAVNMLVNTEEGDTFTLAELRDWLRDAGFDNVEAIDAPAPSPLIVARLGAAARKAA